MNIYDTTFIENLKDILENGTHYKSRARWDDGKQAMCIKKFGIINRYNSDLSNTPPIGTLRKFPIKNCIDELLWIWQKKSNNIKDLNSHVWDSWADANGSIGAAYGFQIKSKLRKVNSRNGNLYLDQTDFVIHELKYNPSSRRIITDLYSVDQTNIMGLDPCCYSCTWNVTYKDGEPYLNLLLNQRSQDMIVANNWNVFQYYILQNLFAIECNMKVGELVHVIADAHIYDRHIDIANELINREQYDAPTLWINPDKKNFYDFTIDDFKLENYKYNAPINNIPVAV